MKSYHLSHEIQEKKFNLSKDIPQRTGVSYSQTELVQLSLILGVLLQSGKYKQSILHISLLVKIKGKPLLLKKKKT